VYVVVLASVLVLDLSFRFLPSFPFLVAARTCRRSHLQPIPTAAWQAETKRREQQLYRYTSASTRLLARITAKKCEPVFFARSQSMCDDR